MPNNKTSKPVAAPYDVVIVETVVPQIYPRENCST